MLSINILSLAFNLVFNKSLECLVRLTSCTGFIMMSSLVIIFFLLFINSEELIYFQTSEVPCLHSQTQFIITFTIEVAIIKFVDIVISGLTFEWGMLFRSEIQWCYRDFTRQTVKFLRLKCVLTILAVIVMVSILKPD